MTPGYLTPAQKRRMFDLDMKILAKRPDSMRLLMETRIQTALSTKRKIQTEREKTSRRRPMPSIMLAALGNGQGLATL